MRTSVVIRVRDGAATLGAVLDALAAQDEPHAVVVVDSGSTDGTVEMVRGRGIALVELPAAGFSFGRALNAGAQALLEGGAVGGVKGAADRGEGSAAGGGERGPAVPVSVVVALSADAVPRDAGWLRRMADAFADPSVICAFGETRGLDGRPLPAPVRQDHALAAAHPEWGYSNGAGAFRTELWRERPFREELAGAEDREWALWALAAAPGRVCLLDPGLAVDHDHAHDPLRTTFRRAARERRGFEGFVDLPPYGVRAVAREWWGEQGWHASRARARLSPRRAARLAGTWWGARGPIDTRRMS